MFVPFLVKKILTNLQLIQIRLKSLLYITPYLKSHVCTSLCNNYVNVAHMTSLTCQIEVMLVRVSVWMQVERINWFFPFFIIQINLNNNITRNNYYFDNIATHNNFFFNFYLTLSEINTFKLTQCSYFGRYSKNIKNSIMLKP